MTRRRTLFASCAALMCLAVATAAGAADLRGADLNALVKETQQGAQQSDDMTFVWWIPTEFWVVCQAHDPSMSKEDLEAITAALRPYTLVAVVEGRLGSLGRASYEPEAKVRAGTALKDRRGVSYHALPEESADAGVKALLGAFKPLVAGLIGPMGENMHFLLFPAKTKSGEPICDAQRDGAFSIEVGPHIFKWRLPLGSLLPPKVCPVCGAEVSGAYKFCPWDGTKLP